MISDQSVNAIESLDSFCFRISKAISSDDFDVRVQPGDHLVDDAGADSLTVLRYVAHLQESGLRIDLSEFDTNLLNTGIAYQMWLQTVAAQYQGEN
jgi:aryl carrier-like protein